MSDSSIQQVSPNNTALNAEHYQTFEMAKANDGILGGDDIAQIRSYAAYARAQAQAIHKTIAATSGIEDVAAIKEEATETAQTFAKVGIYADQRIGEILRELPKSNKWASNSDTQEVETKADAIKESGISKSQAYDLQAMAANPEVVEAVIAKAEQDGRVVSRSQVLKAIKERDEARKDAEEVSELYGKTIVQRDQAESERDSAIESFEELATDNESLQNEIAELEAKLEKQADEAFEKGFKAAEEQQRYESARVKEVEREVESEKTKRIIQRYERESKRHAEEYESLRHRYESVKNELKHLQKQSAINTQPLQESTFSQAVAELISVRRKYSEVSELSDVFSAIDAIKTN